jgi:hypothetical protein
MHIPNSEGRGETREVEMVAGTEFQPEIGKDRRAGSGSSCQRSKSYIFIEHENENNQTGTGEGTRSPLQAEKLRLQSASVLRSSMS